VTVTVLRKKEGPTLKTERVFTANELAFNEEKFPLAAHYK
jgi:hypothetical protein